MKNDVKLHLARGATGQSINTTFSTLEIEGRFVNPEKISK